MQPYKATAALQNPCIRAWRWSLSRNYFVTHCDCANLQKTHFARARLDRRRPELMHRRGCPECERSGGTISQSAPRHRATARVPRRRESGCGGVAPVPRVEPCGEPSRRRGAAASVGACSRSVLKPYGFEPNRKWKYWNTKFCFRGRCAKRTGAPAFAPFKTVSITHLLCLAWVSGEPGTRRSVGRHVHRLCAFCRFNHLTNNGARTSPPWRLRPPRKRSA